jgi:hypothetical protein
MRRRSTQAGSPVTGCRQAIERPAHPRRSTFEVSWMTRSIGFRGDVRLDEALVLAALCTMLGAAQTRAAEPSAAPMRTTLVVRVYNGADLPPRDVHEASRVASGILAAGGVDVRWKNCPRTAKSPDADACRRPLAANEAVLRLIPAASSMTAESASLGFTVLDRQGRRPVLSTVFMDRVTDVAHRAKVDTPLLTGRAMAHELGHLLLGTSGHAEAGLMRAFWSDETLRSWSRTDWELLPSEIDAIRHNRSQPSDVDVTGGS